MHPPVSEAMSKLTPHNHKRLPLLLSLFLVIAAGFSCVVAQEKAEKNETGRLRILFFGAPTAAHPGHDPITRYRILKKRLGSAGIDLTYSEDPAEVLKEETLASYDALLMYGNWFQNEAMPAAQEKALLDFVEDGGGFIPVHCASASYGGSESFVKLVGGRFQSHGGEEFEAKTIAPNHPAMKGYAGFNAWDETYVHDRLTDDRTVLQTRDDEPWTWVRKQGRGRVFYTASGHDHRVWDKPEFADLMRRAIMWSVGDVKRAQHSALEWPNPKLIEVKLPGYRDGKLVTELPEPLRPEESLKLAQVPTGFELSIFAADPDIVNPIFLQWDERGRAWVIESIDYPNNLQAHNTGHDRITICEDTNDDGKADKFSVFADKLSIPTTLAFTNGGLICTDGTRVLFLKDSDGDDQADIRIPLFNGISMGDTHACVSNFRLAPDNWIYATIGYAGFKGKVGNVDHHFSTGVFRFKVSLPADLKPGADGTLQEYCQLEFLQNTTNNTWGLGFTQDFDILGSTANGNPSWYFSIAKDDYAKADLEAPRTPRSDNNPFFFPSSMDIRQVDQFDRYTAAAGHAFYTSTRFPKEYRDKIAFVCGPTGKLVGNFIFAKVGAGFQTTQSPNNLYNSADAWSAPVHAEVGPDGAVWICDWYNMVIQHNPTPNKNNSGLDAKNGKGNAYMTPLRDTEHGRIYRVYPSGSKNEIPPANVLAGLSHPNQFWRLTSQRLLALEKTDHTTSLQTLIASNDADSPAGIHALGVLQATGKIDLTTIKSALKSPNSALRRAALRLAPLDNTLVDFFIKDGRTTESDPMTRKELYLALARLAPSEMVAVALVTDLEGGALKLANENRPDPILLDAWQIAARRNSIRVLAHLKKTIDPDQKISANLLPNPDFSKVADGKPSDWADLLFYHADPKNVTLSFDPTGGRDSSPALKITATENSDCGAGIKVPVDPNSSYLLSGWIKTANVDSGDRPGCMMNVHGGGKTNAVKGTSDWTRVQMTFSTGSEKSVLIHCLFGGYGGAKGTAWWDDVSLVKTNATNPSTTARQRLESYSVDRIKKTAKRQFVINAKVHERGKAVYDLTCIACHGPDGQGVENAFPPIKDSDWLTGNAEVPAKIILRGLQGPISVNAKNYNSMMPPLTDLTDQQIADVLTFARQSWSNDAAPVAPNFIKKTRAATQSQKTPFTAKELGH